MNESSRRIREFVVANFLFGEDSADLTEDTSFMDGGIIDSTGVLELVDFLEETYGLQIEDREMTLDNLDSIQKVARFVQSKTVPSET